MGIARRSCRASDPVAVNLWYDDQDFQFSPPERRRRERAKSPPRNTSFKTSLETPCTRRGTSTRRGTKSGSNLTPAAPARPSQPMRRDSTSPSFTSTDLIRMRIESAVVPNFLLGARMKKKNRNLGSIQIANYNVFA